MAKIHVYLTFSGNCRETMTFYKDCLGGKLTFQTVGELPQSEQMPPKMKDCILHAELKKGALILRGTDMTPLSGIVRGNNVSLSLDCSSEDEIKRFYEKLSTGGKADHPLEDTYWGAIFGGLTDKFGNHWLLNFDKEQNK